MLGGGNFMKILLVCAGGMSTGILMQKMEKYWKENGENHSINAVGLSSYGNIYQNYDVILMGPQVSFRLKDVKAETGLPVESIPPFDYAICNCENITKLAKKLYAQK